MTAQHPHTSTSQQSCPLTRRWPSLTSPGSQYVVLPQSGLAQLPLAVQNQLAAVLDRVQHELRGTAWPVPRVTPSRWRPISTLDEPGLREAGILAELDADGEVVYREPATGRVLSTEEQSQSVLVSETALS